LNVRAEYLKKVPDILTGRNTASCSIAHFHVTRVDAIRVTDNRCA
jgi:hypothetical protein